MLQDLPAGAAALPAATLVILIALASTTTTLPSRILATLPATLTALATLTTLATLLLAIALLPRVIRVRASHNASSAKVYTVDSGELLFECRRGKTAVASIRGMKKGLTPRFKSEHRAG
jgi:hypothetical protein